MIDRGDHRKKGICNNRNQDGRIDTRERNEVNTHQQEGGGAHIRTDEHTNTHNTIPTIPAIYIEIYQQT